MTLLRFHDLANIFPLIEGAEFDALVADIKAQGLHEPIWLYQGKILDGRNRYRACMAAGIECRSVPYIGNDPVSFVISKNLHRRHLNESQRAMVAAKLATMAQGARTDLSPIGEKSQAEAAQLLNVGKRSVERAKEVREHGAPELQAAVERGQVRVSAAADIASLPEQKQREIVARGKREILEAAKAIRAEQFEAHRVEHIARIAEISNTNAPLPQDRRYPIIYADPPWHFDVYDDSGMQRTPQWQYPTMELADICKLPVGELATPDAVLFMWTTAPHLQQAFHVLAAWGFEYRTHFVWVKDKTGLGYWVRNQHELLLIARRGNLPAPLGANRPPSVINAPRREHSRKPDEVYELIERMYPELPKIELFARGQRPGWVAWGNEVATPEESSNETRQCTTCKGATGDPQATCTNQMGLPLGDDRGAHLRRAARQRSAPN
jgi:N6-adenosine-specific RNA methylase IME4/ParB-like chromosome segregation protein Spo0J